MEAASTPQEPASVASLEISEFAEGQGKAADPLVQFVVVRRDLLKTLDWPVGAVIAQVCGFPLPLVHVRPNVCSTAAGAFSSYASSAGMPRLHCCHMAMSR